MGKFTNVGLGAIIGGMVGGPIGAGIGTAIGAMIGGEEKTIEKMKELYYEGIRNDAFEKFYDAIEIGEELLSADEYDSEVNTLMGKCYYELDSYNEAIQYLKIALRNKPTIDTFSTLGAIFNDKEEYTLALKYYKEAAKRDASYWRVVGDVYKKLEEYEKAIECYKKAIPAYENEKFNAEIDDYELIELINLEISAIYKDIGDCYKVLKDLDNALKYYKEAAEKHNYYFEVLGDFYSQLDKKEKAIEFYRKVIKVYEDENENETNPEWIKDNNEKLFELYYKLGEIYTQINEFNKAMECYKEAIKLNIDDDDKFNQISKKLKQLEQLKTLPLLPEQEKVSNLSTEKTKSNEEINAEEKQKENINKISEDEILIELFKKEANVIYGGARFDAANDGLYADNIDELIDKIILFLDAVILNGDESIVINVKSNDLIYSVFKKKFKLNNKIRKVK